MRITYAPLAVGAAMLAALAVVGCGGEEATPAPTPAPTPEPAIEVDASEFSYDPAAITISSQGSSTIRLVNKGIVEHDLTIDELTFQIAVPIGETAEGTLTDVPPGTYKFYCTVPGHEVNGMVGELVVTE